MNRALTPISQATLGWPFSFALNRLLAAEPWARQLLAPFAGRTLEVRAPPLAGLRFVILPGGTLESGGDDPALVITLRPAELSALTMDRERFVQSLQVAGDAELAVAARTLLRHLRWDVEEDLSRLVGDVAAHRLTQAARGLAAWQAEAARRVMEAVDDYVVEEKRILVSRPEAVRFSAQIEQLREAIERLEQRVRSLG